MRRYSFFRQAVRAFAPSELLALTAAHASRNMELPVGGMPDEWQRFPPWFYSAISRESIIYGNEFRSRTPTNEDIIRLRNIFMDAPVGIEDWGGDDVLAHLMQGISYEQFPYQTSVKEELARSYLLFSSDITDDGERIFPGPNDWAPVLGGTITEALTASFVFAVGAYNNEGCVDPAWMQMPWFDDLRPALTRDIALAVLEKLSATVSEARDDAKRVIRNEWDYPRYAYNPLVKTPLLNLGSPLRYAPQPYFILTSMTAENLYYRGIRTWDRHAFGKAVGLRVQEYVGRQLQHTGLLQVEPEFRWQKKRVGGVDSSDWFVVTPQATILVECKSARTNPTQRSGTPAGLKATADTLDLPYRQLNENARQILGGNPSFKHLPTDRPLIGLVVTAEPFHVANSAELRAMLPSSVMPILTVSLRELEQLAVLPPDILGSALSSIAGNGELNTWAVSRALAEVLPEGFEPPVNILLNQGFEDAIIPSLRDS